MDRYYEQYVRALEANPGSLAIITAQHQCQRGVEWKWPWDYDICAAYSYPLTDPHHFVLEPVIRLEAPDEDGIMCAYGVAGSWVRGKSRSVLSKIAQVLAPAE